MKKDIYDQLKKRIIRIEYLPGQILNESDIAKEFNVSRTPVREVFQQLQKEDLLVILPRLGAQITQIDLNFVGQIIEVKKDLEALAARLAVVNGNEEQIQQLEEIVSRFSSYRDREDYLEILEDDKNFHEVIHQMSHNMVLDKILDELQVHSERLFYYTKYRTHGVETFIQGFNEIIDAIKEKDQEKAAKYAIEHLESYLGVIKTYLF